MSWTKTRSEIAVHKHRFPDQPVPPELYQRLKAERLEEHIRRAVAEHPPLTPEQTVRIAALLLAGSAE
ncbi:hypothetical protein [Sinomonas soli]